MKTPAPPLFPVSRRGAVQIQEELRDQVCLQPPRGPFRHLAAGDAAYRRDGTVFGAMLLFTYPDLVLLESATAGGLASFPYLPGLLTFREAPVLLEAYAGLRTRPDLILVDGQGIAHPRSFGLAAHLGVLLDIPAIGCAKSLLYGKHGELGVARGSTAPLRSGEGRTVGMAVRTREGVKPVYVSPGHRMDLRTSVEVVLSLARGFRIPEPLRQAHISVNRWRGPK
ncbi:MAG: endonuclease V [Deltaproteobacteria bacterium]|nr:endonuclease V [Deltaproteobacteria bacterium]